MSQVLPAGWASRPGGAGAVMLGQPSNLAAVLRFPAPAVGSPAAPGEGHPWWDPGRGSGPTKSHVRELEADPSPVQRSLQRTSPGQNCDHSV